MSIKKILDRVPSGLMLIPLFLGALVQTFIPSVPGFLGSFTNGFATGVVPILAVWFVCLGATIKLKATGLVLRKSGTLLVTKFAVAWLVGFLFSRLVPGGSITTGLLAGLSVIAVVAAMDMTNTGLYAALMNQYGSEEEAGAFVLMNVESGPLLTLLVLGSTGLAAVQRQVFVGLLLPFILGYVLGNIDPKMRDFLGGAVQPIIPFFALGLAINVNVIGGTGLLGIGLGLAVIALTGIPLILCDIFIGKGTGTAGIAASSTAGRFGVPEGVADAASAPGMPRPRRGGPGCTVRQCRGTIQPRLRGSLRPRVAFPCARTSSTGHVSSHLLSEQLASCWSRTLRGIRPPAGGFNHCRSAY